MASFTERLAYIITGNGRDAIKAFKDVRDSANKDLSDADKKIGKLESTAQGVGAGVKGFLGGIGAAGFIAFADAADRAYQRVKVWRVKVQTVFADQAEDVRRWADENNEALGLTDDELAGLAASFGDLIKPMGFTTEQVADMSKEVLDLAGALSAWSGGQRDASEVADILAKAMLGERESLKELGISISEADVQARLAEKGQSKLTGALLQQAKAVATQELLFEKSTDAQKAWSDGSMDAVKAQNKLQAELKETSEDFGKAISKPKAGIQKAVSEIVGAINDLSEVGRKEDGGGWLDKGLIRHFFDSGKEIEKTGGFVSDLASAHIDASRAVGKTSAELENEAKAAEEAREALDDLLDSTNNLFNAQLGYEGAVNSTEDALQDYKDKALEVLATNGKNQGLNEEYERATLDLEQAILRQSSAAAEAAEKQAELSGETFNAGDKAATQRVELEKVAATLAPGSDLRKRLDEWIFLLGTIPRNVTTNLDIDTLGPQGAAEGAARHFGGVGLQGSSTTINNTFNIDARGTAGNPYSWAEELSRQVGWRMGRWGSVN